MPSASWRKIPPSLPAYSFPNCFPTVLPFQESSFHRKVHNPMVLQPGIYPAAVTPFDEKGRIDMLSVARLLAWFEANGCKGAILAGTNGEGPSLSPVEKRDLLRDAMPLRGKLELILGIATSSSDEAIWLCKQAGSLGAKAILLMPPFYFREATSCGMQKWFELVISR